MKNFVVLVFMIWLFAPDSKAQTDTLLINFKNGRQDKFALSDLRKIMFYNVTSVVEKQTSTTNLRLEGNHPNPFSEQTSLEFELSSPGAVVIIIYDHAGKYIQTLRCENCPTGKNSLQWNCMDSVGNRVQTGMYFYEVRYSDEIQSKRMFLIK